MSQIVDFLGAMLGTRTIEVTAAVFGLLNVALIMKRSMWNYPFGIATVVLYAWIFYEAQLYSEALLQIFFLVIQIFGIFWWLDGREASGLIKPIGLPVPATLILLALTVTASTALGFTMATYTSADLPYWDAATAVLSVVAQFLMARRYLQSWLVWILVDVLAIRIYWTKDLTPTAALYVVFLGLAISGFLSWRSSMREAGVKL